MKKLLRKLLLVFGIGGGLIVAAGRATVQADVPAIPDVISPEHARNIVNDINRRVFNGWFNPGDVMAVIEIESSFRPKVTRYEAHLNDSSTGLMQLLMSTARDRGFKGDQAELMKPETNILYGMTHLKWSYDYLAARKSKVNKEEWISSYNAGVGNAMKGYISSIYIRKFNVARAKYV